MSHNLEKAHLLIQQSRYDLAEKELRLALAGEPDSPLAHSMLAIVLSNQNRRPEALEEAQRGVALQPGSDYAHFVLAVVLHDAGKSRAAEAAVREAIRLNPFDADYFSLLASAKLQQRAWQPALEYAEKGLEVDAGHVNAANIRAMALMQLGRRAEAGATIETALSRDPDNAVTHANRGWTLLEAGDHNKAMEHFREALRLDPNLDWAREGIVEALKAHNPLYRLMLRYFFRMSRLSDRAQWGIIIGAIILIRLLRVAGEKIPALAPFVWPVMGLYIAFAIMTWTAEPLFNLLLRLNRFGRLALSAQQIRASNGIAACLLTGLALLLAGFSLSNTGLFWWAGAAAAMMVPVSGIFRARPGMRKRIMIGYNTLLLLVIAAGVGADLAGSAAGEGLLGIFIIAWVVYSWIANFLIRNG